MRGTKLMRKAQAPACILLSGGIDSMACLHFFQRLNPKPKSITCLHFSYGQRSEKRELLSAKKVAMEFKCDLDVVAIRGIKSQDGMTIGRNAAFIFTALMKYRSTKLTLGLGIHSGTPFPDCSGKFLEEAQGIADIYAGGSTQIRCPFVSWTKVEIWTYCKTFDLPTTLCYSCQRGGLFPCEKCHSCLDRAALDDL
jgi:7-cyano-7-deazaguanine synthase